MRGPTTSLDSARCLQTLAQATNASMLLFARDILPPMISIASELPTPRLRTLFDAARDAGVLLWRATVICVHPTLRSHLRGPAAAAAAADDATDHGWLDALHELLIGSVENHVLAPLALSAETDLRYAQHAEATSGSPSGPPSLVRSLCHRLCQSALPIRRNAYLPAAHVGHYLDTAFYNLTTVALHDWRTYAEMRAIATQRYKLHPASIEFVQPQLPSAACLPGQTMEEGLDVLQIMRNIRVFVTNFRYNLNSQTFVESGTATDGKHLNMVGIRHIAASIGVHGAGIMNTAVNFCFLFLHRKLVIFSQFLFDDHIKSKLVREARQHRALAASMREQSRVGTAAAAGLAGSVGGGFPQPLTTGDGIASSRYPYDRAEKLHKDVRKLGEVPKDKDVNVLDSFRTLVTEIGNAMGYVRMVRAGGVHQVGGTMQCLPVASDALSLSLPPSAPGTPPSAAGGGGGIPASERGNTGAGDESVGSGWLRVRELREPFPSANGLTAHVVDGLQSSFDDPGEYFSVLEDGARLMACSTPL